MKIVGFMDRRYIFFGILVLTLLSRVIKIDQPLWPDEAYYAQVAKNLLATGKFTFDGVHAAYESPFFSSAVAMSFVLFGISDFSARIVGPISGTVGVAAVYYLARRLYNERVGIFAAFFLAVLSRHWFFSRMIVPDVLLATIITLVLLFLYESFESNKLKDFIVLGVLLVQAVLIKSIGLLMYPIIAVYAAYRKNFRGLLLVFLISFFAGTPWYLKNPETLSRIISIIKQYTNISMILTFSPPVIAKIEAFHLVFSLIPILLILPFSFYFSKEKIKQGLILFSTILFFVFVVSIRPGNIEISRYLLPILPPIAVLGAFALDEISKRLEKRASYIFIGMFLALTLLVNLHVSASLLEINYPKYAGYKEAGDWLDQNTPADAIIMSNARAIWYYSNRNGTYFPASEDEFWQQAVLDDTYVVIGEWPVHLEYPSYVQTLPERHPSKTIKIITYNDGLSKIHILRAET